MISRSNASFWNSYRVLSAAAQTQARQAYRLFRENPNHPSLRFKKLNSTLSLWSIRFGDGYRAVGQREGDTVTWIWIGTHQAFDKLS